MLQRGNVESLYWDCATQSCLLSRSVFPNWELLVLMQIVTS